MAIYLVDKPNGETAASVANLDPNPKIVLIKDGVYLDPSTMPGKVYAMEDDVEIRGLKDRLAGKVETIGYPELVDMIVEDKVMNFA
ncbi:DsrH/TusB family sulfur relay protein [bacterium]|nr:DsrH/TusB family sulfur relay protein [bacterium]MBU1598916.1 DsrH/TusB family sulfur relay protein [bacterium]